WRGQSGPQGSVEAGAGGGLDLARAGGRQVRLQRQGLSVAVGGRAPVFGGGGLSGGGEQGVDTGRGGAAPGFGETGAGRTGARLCCQRPLEGADGGGMVAALEGGKAGIQCRLMALGGAQFRYPRGTRAGRRIGAIQCQGLGKEVGGAVQVAAV